MMEKNGPSGRDALHVGVVGCGYWGPNLVRNLTENLHCGQISVCDLDPTKLDRIRRRYPRIRAFTEYGKMLAQTDLNAVMVATPVSTHYPLAGEALRAGKHTFVEKPFTAS